MAQRAAGEARGRGRCGPRAYTLLEFQVALVLLTMTALGLASLMIANSRHLRRLEQDLPAGGRKYIRSPHDPFARGLGLLPTPADTPLGDEAAFPPAVNTVSVLSFTKGLLDESIVVTAEQREP